MKQEVAKAAELWLSQDFSEHVGQIVFGSDVAKHDDLVRDLLVQPRHFNAEVAVAASYHMVVDHGDTSLVVFKHEGGAGRLEADLCK